MYEFARDILEDDESCYYGADATGYLLYGGVDAHEGASILCAGDGGHQCGGGDHPGGDGDEHDHVDGNYDGECGDAKVTIDGQHEYGGAGADAEDGEFANLVAEFTGERAEDEGREACHTVHDGELVPFQAEVVDSECAGKWHEHVSTGGDEGGSEECHEVAGFGDGTGQVAECVFFLFDRQVSGDGFHVNHDREAQYDAEGDDHGEGGMPSEVVSENKAYGQAEDLAGGEGHLCETHYPASYFHAEQVGDDGHAYGADDATEYTGDDACDEQEVKVRRDGAAEGTDHEANVEEEQQFFAIEFVCESGGQEAGGTCAECICRYYISELGGGDVHFFHEDGA